MTDNDIIKALECAAGSEILCKDCAYLNIPYPACKAKVANDALDLIKRQKAEIKEQDQAIINALKRMGQIRAEAITEFAERLKEKQWSAHTTFGMRDFVEVIVIDQIAEEMKGE